MQEVVCVLQEDLYMKTVTDINSLEEENFVKPGEGVSRNGVKACVDFFFFFSW